MQQTPTLEEIKKATDALERAEIKCPHCGRWIKDAEKGYTMHYIKIHYTKPA